MSAPVSHDWLESRQSAEEADHIANAAVMEAAVCIYVRNGRTDAVRTARGIED